MLRVVQVKAPSGSESEESYREYKSYMTPDEVEIKPVILAAIETKSTPKAPAKTPAKGPTKVQPQP